MISRLCCNEKNPCSACEKYSYQCRAQGESKYLRKNQPLKKKCCWCFSDECYCDELNSCDVCKKYHHLCRSQAEEASERNQPLTKKCNKCFFLKRCLKRHCDEQPCSIYRDKELSYTHDHIVDVYNQAFTSASFASAMSINSPSTVLTCNTIMMTTIDEVRLPYGLNYHVAVNVHTAVTLMNTTLGLFQACAEHLDCNLLVSPIQTSGTSPCISTGPDLEEGTDLSWCNELIKSRVTSTAKVNTYKVIIKVENRYFKVKQVVMEQKRKAVKFEIHKSGL